MYLPEKLQNLHFLKLALKTLTLSFLREPNTHSSAPACTKYEGIGKISCFDIQSLKLKRYNFDTLPLGGIVGLDRWKQSSRAAMATLCPVGRACYPCFGPSGSWRTSLSLDTRESPVRSEELKGCVPEARKWLFRLNCFSSSKWAQFRHVAFHFIEKHTPLFKFAGFSFIFHK